MPSSEQAMTSSVTHASRRSCSALGMGRSHSGGGKSPGRKRWRMAGGFIFFIFRLDQSVKVPQSNLSHGGIAAERPCLV